MTAPGELQLVILYTQERFAQFIPPVSGRYYLSAYSPNANCNAKLYDADGKRIADAYDTGVPRRF